MSLDLMSLGRDNLPKIKDGAYIINIDEYSDIGTYWVAFHVNNNDVTYFDSYGVEHIAKESIYWPLFIHSKKYV